MYKLTQRLIIGVLIHVFGVLSCLGQNDRSTSSIMSTWDKYDDRVSLRYESRPLDDVLKDLQRQANRRIQLSATGIGFAQTQISISLSSVPFWQAVAELSKKIDADFDRGVSFKQNEPAPSQYLVFGPIVLRAHVAPKNNSGKRVDLRLDLIGYDNEYQFPELEAVYIKNPATEELLPVERIDPPDGYSIPEKAKPGMATVVGKLRITLATDRCVSVLPFRAGENQMKDGVQVDVERYITGTDGKEADFTVNRNTADSIFWVTDAYLIDGNDETTPAFVTFDRGKSVVNGHFSWKSDFSPKSIVVVTALPKEFLIHFEFPGLLNIPATAPH